MDLDALDALMDPHSSSSGGHSSTSDPPIAPSSGTLATPTKRHVKEEMSDDNDTSLPDAGTAAKGLASAQPPSGKRGRLSSGKKAKTEVHDELVYGGDDLVEEGNLEDKPPCPGCKRHILTGTCFVQPGAPLAWALPNGRGSWCRDCFGCWRLRYSASCNLFMLASYIAEGNSRREWILDLVAYLSLKREGIERVPDVQLAARRATLDWVVNMLCLDPCPGHAIRLQDMVNTDGLDPARLINMVDVAAEGVPKHCIGYMQPMLKLSESTMVVMKPISGVGARLRERLALSTDFAKDVEILRMQFPDLCVGDDQSAVVNVASGSAAGAPASSRTKDHHKAETQITWAKNQLAPFQNQEWSSVRESHFTNRINKLVVLKTSCAGQGKEHLVPEIDEWADVLASSKMLVKKHREWAKSSKISKIESLTPFIGKVIAAMQKCGLTPFYGLLQLNMKVIFSCSDGAWDERLKRMADNDLAKLLDLIPADAEVSPEAWLRAVLFQRIAFDIESADVAECDANRRSLQQACQGMQSALTAMATKVELATLCKDFGFLQTMFSAGVDPQHVTVADAAACKAAFHETRFVLICSALEKSAAGVEYMMPLNDLLKRSASDRIADERFEMAQQGMASDDMYRVVATSEDGIYYQEVHRAELICKGDAIVWNSLTDTIQYLVDAHKMWSAVRTHEKYDKMEALTREICKSVEVVDMGLAWLILDMYRALLVNEDEATTMSPVALNHSIEGLDVSATRELFKPGGPFGAAQERCLKSLSAFAATCFDNNNDTSSLINRCVKRANENSAKRSKLLNAFDSIDEILKNGSATMEIDALVCEWRANTNNNGLTKMMNLKDVLDDLRHLGDFKFLEDPDVSDDDMLAFWVDGTKRLSDDAVGQLRALPSWPATAPMSMQCSDKLTLAAAGIVDGFAQMVKPHAFGHIATCTFEGVTLADGLKRLVDDTAFASSKAELVRELLNAGGGTADTFEPNLAGKQAFDFVARVCNDGSTQHVRLSTTMLQTDASSPASEVIAMCALYLAMYEVLAVFIMVCSEMREVSKCLEDHKLREPLVSALVFAERRINDLQSSLVTDENLLKSAESTPWRFPPSKAEAWAKAGLAFIKEIRGRMFEQAALDCRSLTSAVEKKTPRYDHIVNDKVFIQNLAARHLCQNAARATLSADVVALFHSMAQLTSFQKTAGLPDFKDDARFKDIVDHADGIFTAGRQAVVVIAACNVALTKTGEEQKREAEDMIKKRGAELPQALLEFLKGISRPLVGLRRSASAAALQSERE